MAEEFKHDFISDNPYLVYTDLPNTAVYSPNADMSYSGEGGEDVFSGRSDFNTDNLTGAFTLDCFRSDYVPSTFDELNNKCDYWLTPAAYCNFGLPVGTFIHLEITPDASPHYGLKLGDSDVLPTITYELEDGGETFVFGIFKLDHDTTIPDSEFYSIVEIAG